MSEHLFQTKKPTNLKPDSWYKEYFKIENSYLLKHPENQITYDPEHGAPLKTIQEIKWYETMANKNQSHDYCSGFTDFDEKNNLEMNKELLVQYKKDLESLKRWKVIEEIGILDDNSSEYFMLQTHIKIDKCLEALEQGYLITAQLEDIMVETDNYWYNEECDKPIVDMLKQFKFDNYQEELSNFIKLNVNWLHKDRDFEIHKEIKDGTVYSEIAERLNCSISAISKINKKVQSSINNLKGKLFEIEYNKYLKSLNKFRNSEIIRDGAPGKPDIYIIDKTNKELYVFSLKNLELNKKSFSITKEQLKPEIQFAYLKNSFESFNMVSLYLIVFDSLTENLHIRELDYKNPKNINIHS